MLTQDQFTRVVRSATEAKRAATTDELASLNDRAWAQVMTGSRHALLVEHFEQMADAERNFAARLAGQPGRGTQAERARVRAGELYATAQRHRAASEQRQEAGEQLLAEARTMAARGTPTPQPAPALRPGRPAPPAGGGPPAAAIVAEGVEGVQQEPERERNRRLRPEADG